MRDLIDRQAAIKNAHFPAIDDASYEVVRVDDILALPSAQPVAKDINVPVRDCISRQAAIDALGERPVVWSDNDDYTLGERNQYDMDRLAIETVPPAQLAQDLTNGCTDTISRQAAIEAMRRAKDKSELHRMLVQLPSAQPEQRWIPCSEQMPKEKDAGILKKLGTNRLSDYVIATVEVKGERMTVIIRTHDGVWHWDKKYAFPDYKVVAWMPMPKPWEGAQS